MNVQHLRRKEERANPFHLVGEKETDLRNSILQCKLRKELQPANSRPCNRQMVGPVTGKWSAL